jgi:hypothetical protein
MDSPKTGTGSGHDRCTEAVVAMVNCTYKLGPKAKEGVPPEQIMLDLTEYLNNGSDNSAPENLGIWFPAWLARYGYDKVISLNNVHNPSFLTVQEVIDNGHIAVGGFNDYVSLRLADGSNPYKWSDPHGLGHVLLIVGYDSDKHTVVVHDPLRANPDGQPADYSWQGFVDAGFADCTQIVGAKLPYSVDTDTTPAPPSLDNELAAWRAYGAAVEAALVNLGKLPKPPV